MQKTIDHVVNETFKTFDELEADDCKDVDDLYFQICLRDGKILKLEREITKLANTKTNIGEDA